MRQGERPGSDGEHLVQQRLGTTERADRFYGDQVLDHLNDRMREFVARQEMFFLSTADRHGECDASFRAGPAGFVQVLDERTLAYPEYRGNGVMASVGNMSENPRLGLLMVDFTRNRIGLHINGRARVVMDEEMRASHPGLPVDPVPGRRAQLWVMVGIEEAYIHCSKHIPHLQKVPAQQRGARAWGTDDYKRKGGDFFGAAEEAPGRAPFRRVERKDEQAWDDPHREAGDAPAYDGAPFEARVPAFGELAANGSGDTSVNASIDASADASVGARAARRAPAPDGFAAELNGAFLDRVERVLARAQPRRAAEGDPEFRGWFS
ncbi:pyridoxamine 5'-phosphate oxidase family protein [Streptomyces sp. NPDC017993]|uniref:pyridoxamine 5'-phosphate oxidase family protein n=1 Tax=Streptomyces sp. NPDC017993 TaxID=3365027 RepID=UPI00379B61DA